LTVIGTMTLRKSIPCIFLPLVCLLFAELSLPGGVIRRFFGTPSDDTGVHVVEERVGSDTHLFVTTDNCLDITFTLEARLQNIAPSLALPLTVETNGHRRVEIVRLRTIDSAKPAHYSYTYRWLYGGRGGQPDGTVYLLPFRAGETHKLFQGYGGTFSHQPGSPNHYAHDWDLPQNSIVLAARGGLVVGVRQDSDAHGVIKRFENSGNYVIIRHADGTYGEYLHLRHLGSLVKIGDTVIAGQEIALSGNTGLSSRPHLHFAVFRVSAANTRETLPVKFRTSDGLEQLLEEGRTY
jgi:murein DD-endopeptidase MepM/ murein hydrolase activator NlpD